MQRGIPESFLAQYSDVFDLFKGSYTWLQQHQPHQAALVIQAAASEQLERVERSLVPSSTAIPGVRDALVWLAARRIPVAVVSTNSQEVVEDCLRRHNLQEFIVFVLGRHAHMPTTELKPAPDTIAIALEVVGCHRDRAIYVGDSVADVVAGTAAGVFTIGVLTGWSTEAELQNAGARRVVASFSAITQLLD
jgi:phosphoglycolate phosphatase-like HAD superfamily hydrolase